MADYEVQDDANMYAEDSNHFNDYGAGEAMTDIDDIPVTQEDAWAVIS